MELIIAIFLITTVFVSLIAVYPMLFRHASLTKNRLLAMSVSRNIVETIKAVPWGASVTPFIKSNQTFHMVIEGEQQSVTFKVKEIKFDPANAAGTGPDPGKLTSNVTITLEWQEGTGAGSKMRNRTLTTVSVISKEQ